MQLLRKIKSGLARLIPSKRTVIRLAIVGVVAWFAVGSVQESRRIYMLTILGMSPMGIVPLGQLQVRGVVRHIDGSLCFTAVEAGKRACLKMNMYDLSELDLE